MLFSVVTCLLLRSGPQRSVELLEQQGHNSGAAANTTSARDPEDVFFIGSDEADIGDVAPYLPPQQARRADGVVIVHIGKTGGTNVRQSLSAPSLHKVGMTDHEPGAFGANPMAKYVFFVRDPVTRFVSGWISRFRKGQPRYYVPWTAAERVAFTTFPTPDALATALSSPNVQRRHLAEQSFRAILHVQRGISFMLGGLLNLRQHLGQVLFVGRTEHLESDFRRLQEVLKAEGALHGPVRPLLNTDAARHATPSQYESLEALSPQAIANLHGHYASDYACIRLMVEHSKLPGTYLAEVGA